MTNFYELFRKYNPLSGTPGAEDLEAKNAYWIRLGERRALEAAIKVLQDADSVCAEWAIALLQDLNRDGKI